MASSIIITDQQSITLSADETVLLQENEGVAKVNVVDVVAKLFLEQMRLADAQLEAGHTYSFKLLATVQNVDTNEVQDSNS